MMVTFVRKLDTVGTKRFATVAFADENLYIPVSHCMYKIAMLFKYER